MGSWVGYYQKHARETSALPADQVPPPPPYTCPEAGTFVDDGDHRDLHYSLHSFPTRRSSDLPKARPGDLCTPR